MNAAIDYDRLSYTEVKEVKDALSRPLEFGDPKQIRALKLLEQPPLEEGKSKRFKVTVEFSGEFSEYSEYVDANSKREAIEKMQDEILGVHDECEVDITATEIPT